MKGLPGLPAEAGVGAEHSRNSSLALILFVLSSLQSKPSKSRLLKGPVLKNTKHSTALSGDGERRFVPRETRGEAEALWTECPRDLCS